MVIDHGKMSEVGFLPQGSILGPLLSLLYVDDLPDSVKAMAKMFADDTKP